MIKTIPIIAALCLIAQIAFFIGFGFLVADLVSLTYVIAPEMRADPSLLAPFVRDTIVSYQAVLWTGLAGAIVYCVIYVRKVLRARWFLMGARILVWLWFLLVPIGTIVWVILIS